jgi:drug/metabolite transporter (DMT)-like permease
VTPQPEPKSARLLLTLSAASFGLTWVAGPWATDEIPPLAIACARFTIAAVLLYAFCRLRGIPIPVRRADVPLVLGVTLTSVVVYNVLFLYGVRLAAASHGAVIVPGLIPVVTLVLARIVFGERVALVRVAGAALGILGLGLVVGPAFAGGADELTGDLMFAAGAMVWAVYAILGRSATRRFHAAAITCLSAAIGAVVFAVLSLAFETDGFAALASASVRAIGSVVYLGTFGTVLSFVFFYLGVERIGSARASAYAVLIPLFGVAATVTVLGEPIEPLALAGAALVVVGLRMMQAGEHTVGRSERPSDAAGTG